ncbi:MAG: hypothetical protein ACYS8W_19595, partial [Planctomycetota bacterium]
LPGKQVDISRPGIIISGDRLRYEPTNRQANFSGNIRGRLEPSGQADGSKTGKAAQVYGAWNFTASNLEALFGDNEDVLTSIKVRDGVTFFADPGPYGEKAEFKADVAVYDTAVPKVSFVKDKNRPHMRLEIYSESLEKVLPNEIRADKFEMFPVPGLVLASRQVNVVEGDFYFAEKNQKEATHLRFTAPKIALRTRQDNSAKCRKCGMWNRVDTVFPGGERCENKTCRAAVGPDAERKRQWRLDEIFAFGGIEFSSYEPESSEQAYVASAKTAIYESERGTVSLRGEPTEVVIRGEGRVTQRDVVYDIGKQRMYLHNPDYIYPWKRDPSDTEGLRKAFEDEESDSGRNKR